MKALLLLAAALILAGFFQRRAGEASREEISRRSRRILVWGLLIVAALAALCAGIRLGMLGIGAGLAGFALLAGSLFVGLMKLRAWFS